MLPSLHSHQTISSSWLSIWVPGHFKESPSSPSSPGLELTHSFDGDGARTACLALEAMKGLSILSKDGTSGSLVLQGFLMYREHEAKVCVGFPKERRRDIPAKGYILADGEVLVLRQVSGRASPQCVNMNKTWCFSNFIFRHHWTILVEIAHKNSAQGRQPAW